MPFRSDYPPGCPQGTKPYTGRYYRFKVVNNIKNNSNHKAPATRIELLDAITCEHWGLSGYLTEEDLVVAKEAMLRKHPKIKWGNMYYELTPQVGQIKHTPLDGNAAHHDLYICEGVDLSEIAESI